MKRMLRVKQLWFFAGLLLFALASPAKTQTTLTAQDVQTIIAHAVSAAVAMNQKVAVSVTDREGHLLGTFIMTGARPMTLIRSVGRSGQGLENFSVPSTLAANSKAGTAGIFSTGGNAFTTRTAGFIIQEHFPPGVNFQPGGPLYGVQFSTLLCSDVAIAGLPLGLSADPGGVPLYKNGVAVGGVGVEGDGLYTVDRDPYDLDQPFEEVIAIAGQQGFEPPPLIRADNILVGGIRFVYANVTQAPQVTQIPFANLPGFAVTPISGAPASDFIPATLNGIQGQRSVRFPTINGASITAAETDKLLGDAAVIADITRAAIRQPIGINGRVTIAVVDVNGKVTGIFRQLDAPVFGFDVSVQKARSVVFFSRPDAAAKLQAAGFGSYVSRAAADGIQLNGSIAFSDRAIGFLHRPFFPDGINDADAGPFSTPLSDWSPFNVGLQLDLIRDALTQAPTTCKSAAITKRQQLSPCPCTTIPELPNGLQIFAGATPIYRGNTLVGAVGISGDGIDQDDFVSAAGANSLPPPDAMRSDKFFVRGVRLPFLKFPARATLP